MGDTGQCRSCPATIEWAKTYKADAAIPLDVEPAPKGEGNLLLLPSANKTVSVNKDDARWLEGLGIELRRSHFATCPAADKNRRRS